MHIGYQCIYKVLCVDSLGAEPINPQLNCLVCTRECTSTCTCTCIYMYNVHVYTCINHTYNVARAGECAVSKLPKSSFATSIYTLCVTSSAFPIT